MSKVIRISNELHKRLERYAVGFDTPANVIERVLNQMEGQHDVLEDAQDTAAAGALLPIKLIPEDEARFKKELLKIKKATIRIFYNDGRMELKTWNAFKFDSNSSVMGNLRSRAEFRQDVWQQDGISHVEVEIDYTL
jgi:hypothetical protein